MKTSTIVLIALAGFVLFSGRAQAADDPSAKKLTSGKKTKPKQIKLTAAQQKEVKKKIRAM